MTKRISTRKTNRAKRTTSKKTPSNLAMKMNATTAKLNAAPVAKPNARLAPFASYEASKVLRVVIVIVVVLVGIGAACS